MVIVQLHTGLFPDVERVEAALDVLSRDHGLRRLDVSRGLNEDGWDDVVATLLKSDRIVTT